MATETNPATMAAAHACWSCGDMRASQFCTSCGKVQPPQPVDYFSFFGLPRKMNIEGAALEREFYSLSRKLHPDLHAGSADSHEQDWTLEQSSRLNDAYRTLKDPIRRTEYLLKLEGVELEGQSKAATEEARKSGEKKQIVPPDLLEEVFELNMQLEEARAHKKIGEQDPSLVSELNKQKESLETKLNELFNELGTYWNNWDAAEESGNEAAKKQARDHMLDLLNRRSYIRNLVRDVNEVLES